MKNKIVNDISIVGNTMRFGELNLKITTVCDRDPITEKRFYSLRAYDKRFPYFFYCAASAETLVDAYAFLFQGCSALRQIETEIRNMTATGPYEIEAPQVLEVAGKNLTAWQKTLTFLLGLGIGTFIWSAITIIERGY